MATLEKETGKIVGILDAFAAALKKAGGKIDEMSDGLKERLDARLEQAKERISQLQERLKKGK